MKGGVVFVAAEIGLEWNEIVTDSFASVAAGAAYCLLLGTEKQVGIGSCEAVPRNHSIAVVVGHCCVSFGGADSAIVLAAVVAACISEIRQA